MSKHRREGHIRERSPGVFLIKYQGPTGPDGKRRSVYKTIHGTRREAAAELRECLRKVDTGEHVDRSAKTLSAYIDDPKDGWFKRATIGLSAQSVERYRQIVDNQIIPALGATKLQSLTGARIDAVLAELQTGDRPLSARTARQVHMLVNRIVRAAVKERLIARNIMDDVDDRPKATKKRIAPLTPEQVQTVIERLAGKKIRVPVLVALYTGMRRGEVLALRWNDLDLDAGTIRIDESVEETKEHGRRVKTPKTESGNRTIAIGAVLVGELRAFRQRQLERRMRLGLGKMAGDGLLFPSPQGEPTSPNRLSEAWNLFAKSIGLENTTFHTLRHSHASHLIRQAIDLVTISRRLGHSSPAFTMSTYAHMLQGGDRHAADAFDVAMGTS